MDERRKQAHLAIVTQAVDVARAGAAAFDKDDWQGDIGGKRRQWWVETFLQRGDELVALVEKILRGAKLQETGCLSYSVPRKRVKLGGHGQYAYEVIAYGVAGVVPTDRSVIRHLCHNEHCVHPDHLRIGTQRENHADDRGRRARKHR